MSKDESLFRWLMDNVVLGVEGDSDVSDEVINNCPSGNSNQEQERIQPTA